MNIYTNEQQACLDMYAAQSLLTDFATVEGMEVRKKYEPLSEENRRKIFPAGALIDNKGLFELD